MNESKTVRNGCLIESRVLGIGRALIYTETMACSNPLYSVGYSVRYDIMVSFL